MYSNYELYWCVYYGVYYVAFYTQGADYVIALTHMRWPNDTRLAEEVDEIDLFLGGHDHDYNKMQVGGLFIADKFKPLTQSGRVTHICASVN